jgi:hypothetical protein
MEFTIKTIFKILILGNSLKNNLVWAKRTFILALIISFLPLYLVFYKPILFPFADDWLIIGWSLNEYSLFDRHSIQLINGHQYFLSKAWLQLMGLISAGNIQLISVTSIVLGFMGIIFLVQSQVNYLGNKVNMIFLISILLIAANYKQMQNLFMPISNGWMLGIFFIGIYYWLKQKQDFYAKKYLVATTIVLAPLTFGLGIILPILELIEIIYIFSKNRISATLLRNQASSIIVSISSIAFFLLIPLLKMGDVNGFPTDKNLSNILNIIRNPEGSLLYVLTLIGNIFVPASRFEPTLPILAGSVFVFASILLLWPNFSKIKADDIFLNKNCMLGGLIFIVILFLFRYSGTSSDIQMVAAPRYVTGSLLFIIGVLGIIQKVGNNSRFIMVFLLVTSSLTLASGLKTGLEWHSTRYTQSQTLIACANTMESLNTEFTEDQSCFTLAYDNSISPSKDYFRIMLKKFIEKLSND